MKMPAPGVDVVPGVGVCDLVGVTLASFVGVGVSEAGWTGTSVSVGMAVFVKGTSGVPDGVGVFVAVEGTTNLFPSAIGGRVLKILLSCVDAATAAAPVAMANSCNHWRRVNFLDTVFSPAKSLSPALDFCCVMLSA
jgi:hypothetical protein